MLGEKTDVKCRHKARHFATFRAGFSYFPFPLKIVGNTDKNSIILHLVRTQCEVYTWSDCFSVMFCFSFWPFGGYFVFTAVLSFHDHERLMPVCLLHSGNSQLATDDIDRVHVQEMELGGTALHPHKWSHAISKWFLLFLFFFFF